MLYVTSGNSGQPNAYNNPTPTGASGSRSGGCGEFIIAVLVGILGVGATLLAGNSEVQDAISNMLRTKEVNIPANVSQSGSTTFLFEFSCFDEFPAQGPGDLPIPENDLEDQAVKVFMTFSLDNIPEGSEIIEASVTIPCKKRGRPHILGVCTWSITTMGHIRKKYSIILGWMQIVVLGVVSL